LAHRDIQSANKNGGIPEWLRILHVEQEIAGDETPALASVLLADAYRTGLLRREKELSELLQLTGGSKSDKDALSMELKDIYQRLIDCESDKAETRAATILSGLGFSKEQQQQPTRMFSGGIL
jgi:ATP-binding cassette subfamily F protein 3